jgi:hypothetical protein
MIRVAWKKPVLVPQGRSGRGKKVPVHAAIVKGNTDRFLLYQKSSTPIPTMWTLWDQAKDVQHYLYGEGLAGAKSSATQRIQEVLEKEHAEPR